MGIGGLKQFLSLLFLFSPFDSSSFSIFFLFTSTSFSFNLSLSFLTDFNKLASQVKNS